MYTYEPSTEKLICVSCIPSGAPPTSDVEASQDGLFLTDDGRTFFSTEDALVPSDTNHAEDVYEYVDGRPQLITPGTGDTPQPEPECRHLTNICPASIGVSANGTDVYFSTYDTLVPQDHNGNFLKFYDARTDGGFSSPAPPPPCEAADECHGAGTTPPPALQGESSAEPHRRQRRPLRPPQEAAPKAQASHPPEPLRRNRGGCRVTPPEHFAHAATVARSRPPRGKLTSAVQRSDVPGRSASPTAAASSPSSDRYAIPRRAGRRVVGASIQV